MGNNIAFFRCGVGGVFNGEDVAPSSRHVSFCSGGGEGRRGEGGIRVICPLGNLPWVYTVN